MDFGNATNRITETAYLLHKDRIRKFSQTMQMETTLYKYQSSDQPELLRLLLSLQHDYFKAGASPLVQEVEKEQDTEAIYRRYIAGLELEIAEGTTAIFLAKSKEITIGFIIGRVSTDEDLVLNPIGVVEDWFVAEKCRKLGAGFALYNKLETWFREKNCKHLQSATWSWNEVSIAAHKRLGFEITEVKFVKKL
ncbi:MAG: family N-acetyltransferase [Bacteroidetes bacterium]|nr:family N-acetyltransferase [Bacteroidota bacterium]